MAFADAALVALRVPLGPQSLQSSSHTPWWMRVLVELICTVSRVQRFDPWVGPEAMVPVPWVANIESNRLDGPGVVSWPALSAVEAVWTLVESTSMGEVVSTPA